MALTIKDAFLNAASHIERHPTRYAFLLGTVPDDERGRACMLAWAAFFLGFERGTQYTPLLSQLGVREEEFYARLDELTRAKKSPCFLAAKDAARGLRLYVEKYL